MKPETLEQLKIVAGLLEAQDNRYTSDPIFMVQERVRDIGMDPDYSEEHCYVHSEGEVVTYASDQVRYERFASNEFLEDDGDRDDWTHTGIRERWESVQPFLTDAAAQWFCGTQHHRFRGPLRVYVASGYRNLEWQWLRGLVLEAGKEIESLTAERDEARAGYLQLDINWEKMHEACMKPIRAAIGAEDCVPEIVRRISVMRACYEATRRFIVGHAPDVANELSRCPGDIAEAFDRFLKEFNEEDSKRPHA